MKISDFIDKKCIKLNAPQIDKTDTIAALVEFLLENDHISEFDSVFYDVLKREAEGSTGLGNGLATPHAQNPCVKRPCISAITCPQGIDFKAIDNKPSRLIMLFAAPKNAPQDQLMQFGKLSILLMNPDFKESLIAAKSVDEFVALIDKEEEARSKQENSQTVQATSFERILAVTACPTGISSSYMATEALEKAAAKKGLSIHVETHGAGGVFRELSDEEIQNADAIIVAASKKIPMHRFNGKKLLSTGVGSAIRNSDNLLDRVLTGHVTVYKSSGEDDDTPGARIWKKITKLFG